MFVAMIIVFVLGYVLIALEHPIKINKSATALLLGVILWVMLMAGGESTLVNTFSIREFYENVVHGSFNEWVVDEELLRHLGEISEILFFLLGAMTIVELVDSYEGFRIITDKIKTTRRSKLLWVTSILTFFMSAALDNLTTSIVMVALLRKLIYDKKDRWFFAGMVIVAANAGGAWSPIGDVTTIMLWIAGDITALNIMLMTFIPSMISMILPLVILSFYMKGTVQRPERLLKNEKNNYDIPDFQSKLIFFIGVGGLLFVPVFKNLTHLPPYLGMLFSLGVLWTVTEILHMKRPTHVKENSKHLTIMAVLQKIDVTSVLFFLGILTAVAALSTTGHLELLAQVLQKHVGNLYVINIIIGLLSAVVDNVPLVAGAMGMYNFGPDHYFWEFLAYCAGTGGSILIIGSAAGVAVMGMEKIDFIWYLKKISLLALIGYLGGGAAYIIQEESGIMEFKDSNSAFVINFDNKQEISQYLLSYQFVVDQNTVAEQGENTEYELNFIQFEDKKKGGDFIGYKIKESNGQNGSWGGKLMEGDFRFQKLSDDDLKVTVLDKVFHLHKDGKLFEEKHPAGQDEVKMLEWSRSIVEE